MRAVVQRVLRAEVAVDGGIVGQIGPGLLVLLCIEDGDDEARIERGARKISKLRCFADEAGKMNLDLEQIRGEMLVVSQFTLAADLQKKGRRPGFDRAAPPDLARKLYARFVDGVAQAGIPVATGSFGTHMRVSLVNDGPVTFIHDDRGPDPG